MPTAPPHVSRIAVVFRLLFIFLAVVETKTENQQNKHSSKIKMGMHKTLL
jgi:hypothetical protein